MVQLCVIKKIIIGEHTVDGAGVNLVRVFGYKETKELDPFLMLDAFDSTDPTDYIKGFPWHPHRGIETITYLIEGDIEHGDNLGNKGSILDGDCQWMTAGSGIIHQEMPKASPRMLGVQLWLNLPQKDKMTTPHYHEIRKVDIPVCNEGDRKIHIIGGTYHDIKGAFEGGYVKPLYLDVEMKKNAEWSIDIDQESTMFIYVLQGTGAVLPENSVISKKQAILFHQGNQLMVKAADTGMRFLLLAGRPLKEPIAWGGPIVMNTKAELKLAFKELEDSTFIK
jgi:hypothetical protein